MSTISHQHFTQSQRDPLHLPRLALRTRAENPDHHLWNNNGTWWCHFTRHQADYTKERVRLSLHTHDRKVARLLRDTLLSEG